MRFQLHLDPFEETYESVTKLLSAVIKRFRKRHKIDPEEARSLANLAFVVAYESYEHGRSSFAHWVAYKVEKYLLSGLRSRIAQERKISKEEYDLDRFSIPDPSEFRLDDLYATLSEDAREVVTIAIRPPKGVEKIIRSFGKDSEINHRMAMRQYLRDRNWTEQRIAQTFREVKRAL